MTHQPRRIKPSPQWDLTWRFFFLVHGIYIYIYFTLRSTTLYWTVLFVFSLSCFSFPVFLLPYFLLSYIDLDHRVESSYRSKKSPLLVLFPIHLNSTLIYTYIHLYIHLLICNTIPPYIPFHTWVNYTHIYI